MIDFNIVKPARKYFNEFFWVIVGNITFLAGNFIFIKFISSTINPIEYGVFSLGLTIIMGINQIIVGPYLNSIHRHISIVKKHQKLHYINHLIKKYLKLFTLICIVIFLSILLFKRNLNFNSVFVFTLFIYALLQGLNDFFVSFNDANRSRKKIAIFKGLEPFFRIGVLYFIFRFFFVSASSLVAGYTISILVSCLFFLLASSTLKKTGFLNNLYLRKLSNSINHYSINTMVYGIFTWILLSSDRWIIEYFFNSKELGLYIIVMQLGYFPMLYFGNIVSQFFTPIFYEKKTNNFFEPFMYLILISSLILSFLSWIFNHQITNIFLTNDYFKYSKYLPIFILGGGIYSAGQYLSIYFQKKMLLSTLLKIKVVTSVIGVSIYFYCAYKFGIEGLIFGLFVFSMIFFLTMIFFLKK